MTTNKKQNTALAEILCRLMFEHKIKATELARNINIPQPTIHRIAAGKSPNPHHATLEAIATFFKITTTQLTGDTPLPPPFGPQTNSTPTRLLPLLTWEELSKNQPINQIITGHRQAPSVVASPNIPATSFAITLKDSSMIPQFTPGTVLIFKPEQAALDRQFILARLKNHSVVFRQLLTDNNYQYLTPLNPDQGLFRMRVMDNDDKIIATLIEARRNYADSTTI